MQIHKTALLLSLGYAAAERGEKDIVDLRDRDAVEAAQYAVDNLPRGLYKFQKTKLDSNCDYLTAEILDGDSQVVAGMKYDLDIEVVDCDHYCVGIFEAEIYVDPSWNIQVTEWGSEKSCDEVDSFDGDGDSFDGFDYDVEDNDAFDSFDGFDYDDEDNDAFDSFDGFDYDDEDNDAFDSFDGDVDSFDGYDYDDEDNDAFDSFDSNDSDDFPNMKGKVLKDPLVVADDLTATAATADNLDGNVPPVVADDLTATAAPTDNLDGNVPPVVADDLTATAATADNVDGTVRRLNSPSDDSDDSDDEDEEWDSYDNDDTEDYDSDDDDYYYGDRR